MFEFMDGIVDALEEFVQATGDIAVFVMICIAKAVLIITAPVWVLPYELWRKGRKHSNTDSGKRTTRKSTE